MLSVFSGLLSLRMVFGPFPVPVLPIGFCFIGSFFRLGSFRAPIMAFILSGQRSELCASLTLSKPILAHPRKKEPFLHERFLFCTKCIPYPKYPVAGEPLADSYSGSRISVAKTLPSSCLFRWRTSFSPPCRFCTARSHGCPCPLWKGTFQSPSGKRRPRRSSHRYRGCP